MVKASLTLYVVLAALVCNVSSFRIESLDRTVDDYFEEFGRIVNGRQAEPGEIKYQAALLHKDNFNFCGGTLIKTNWVLTAAHCARNQIKEDLKVVLGALNLKDPNNLTYPVKNIIVHHYDDSTKRGDLALLELESQPISGVSDREHLAEPMTLPTEDLNIVGKMCTVSGWGRLKS